MSTAVQPSGGIGASAGSSTSSLAEVIETILDKGIVIDAHVSVALVGIQILTVDARVVVASVDTYLRFAEAVNRLDLTQHQGKSLPDVVDGVGGGAMEKVGSGAAQKAGEVIGELVGGGGRERQRAPRRRQRDEED